MNKLTENFMLIYVSVVFTATSTSPPGKSIMVILLYVNDLNTSSVAACYRYLKCCLSLSAVGPSDSPSVLFFPQSYMWRTLSNFQSHHISYCKLDLGLTSCHCVDGTHPPVFCIWLLHHRRA